MELTSKEVSRKAGIPIGSLPYWAARAGVTFERQAIVQGRTVSYWRSEVVKRLAAAWKAGRRTQRRKAVAATATA